MFNNCINSMLDDKNTDNEPCKRVIDNNSTEHGEKD